MIPLTSLSSLSPLALVGVDQYSHMDVPCQNVKRFQSLGLDSVRSWVYDKRFGFDRLLAVGGSVGCWTH